MQIKELSGCKLQDNNTLANILNCFVQELRNKSASISTCFDSVQVYLCMFISLLVVHVFTYEISMRSYSIRYVGK